MNKISYKLLISFLLIYVLSIFYCTKPQTVSIENILPKHQWRKTKEAVYNSNNEFEKYTFLFETAKDCEKNSFWTFGYPSENSNMYIYDICKNSRISFIWKIKNDSLILSPWDFDTLHIRISKYIDYYNKEDFILRYDTVIENKTKIIKETYSAFDL